MIIQEKFTVTNKDWTIAIKFLEEYVDLSKSKLKDAMNKGCIWRNRDGVRERLRHAQAEIRTDDVIEVFYNSDLLMLAPKELDLLDDRNQYSVWNKPAGMPMQGDDWGDFNAVLRLVKLMAQGERHVYLVSDLDAEASGVMLVGHQKRTATYLNKLQKTGQIKECYRIEAQGEVDEAGEINSALDKQDAITQYQRISYNDHGNSSKVDVQLQSGIKDQLRRHFTSIGHPVIGDAVYGENSDGHRGGIRLRVTALELQCPVKDEAVSFNLY